MSTTNVVLLVLVFPIISLHNLSNKFLDIQKTAKIYIYLKSDSFHLLLKIDCREFFSFTPLD
jgi:hypothetical protein